MSSDIQVHVRVRPLMSPTAGGPSSLDVTSQGDIVAGGRPFQYPSSIVQGSSQKIAYDSIAPRLLARLQDGYSVTLLAYGQTGSGKTYTMFGPAGSLSETALEQAGANVVPEAWGIFPRMMMHLRRMPGLGSMHASAIEVYSNNAYDLLAHRAPIKIGQGYRTPFSHKSMAREKRATNSGSNGYPARERYMQQQAEKAARKAKVEALRNGAMGGGGRLNSRSSASVSAAAARQRRGGRATSSTISSTSADSFATVGEKLIELSTDADIARLARQVEASRVAHGHALNARSSRSHCLIHVHLVTNSNGVVSKRQLLFVDLAGSERIAKSKVEGTREKEAVGINKSLTVLGRVIKALGSRGGKQHIPYRDSTLTMLLKSSFGGKSCTTCVINVASESEHAEETVCSLRYGGRMTRVQNNATVVVGQDASGMVDGMMFSLEQARVDLQGMESRGMGPRFAPNADPTAISSMKRNFKLGDTIQRKLRVAQQELIEARARGSSDSCDSISRRVKDLKFQLENNRMIVLRQKNIKNFYQEPKGAWKSKKAEIQELEAQMQMLRGSTSRNRGGAGSLREGTPHAALLSSRNIGRRGQEEEQDVYAKSSRTGGGRK